VRLLRAKVPERQGRGALAESEEPHRAADRWWRGASKVRPEGQVLGAASPVAAGGYQVQEVDSRRCARSSRIPLSLLPSQRECDIRRIVTCADNLTSLLIGRRSHSTVSRLRNNGIMTDPSIDLATRWRNTAKPSLCV